MGGVDIIAILISILKSYRNSADVIFFPSKKVLHFMVNLEHTFFCSIHSSLISQRRNFVIIIFQILESSLFVSFIGFNLPVPAAGLNSRLESMFCVFLKFCLPRLYW